MKRQEMLEQQLSNSDLLYRSNTVARLTGRTSLYTKISLLSSLKGFIFLMLFFTTSCQFYINDNAK